MHGGDAFVPAFDDLALAEREGKRLAPVERAVEFLALLAVNKQPSGIVDRHGLAGLGTGPVPGLTSMMRRPLGVVTSPAARADSGADASVSRIADTKSAAKYIPGLLNQINGASAAGHRRSR